MPDQKQFSEVILRIGGGQTVRIYERQEFYPQNDNLTLSAGLRIGNDPPRRLEDYYESQLSANNYRVFEGGFLVLAGLITLFFFIVSREKLYLYFSLFGLIYLRRNGVISFIIISSYIALFEVQIGNIRPYVSRFRLLKSSAKVI